MRTRKWFWWRERKREEKEKAVAKERMEWLTVSRGRWKGDAQDGQNVHISPEQSGNRDCGLSR
ncbi:hypothetical protein U1Q18_052293, partial [Sarracenia purpurea var. burkii]